MLRRYAQTAAYLLQTAGTGGVLTSCHTGGQVVGYQYHHVGIRVHAVQQTGHAGVGKGAVAYYCYRRMLTRIGGAFGHRHGCTHLDAGVNGVEWREGS